jgi:hypothetical protein
MEFEEFFKKKRINLDALQKVEPALFSEFKTHYVLMGEKSFDHTKKYWFNKLRLQFPAPAEVKTEKVKIDNPLAEQTITESLLEETATPPKLGFTPKFKANVPKPAVTDTPAETQPEEQPAVSPSPNFGFSPKFKAASPPKSATEQTGPTKTEETPTTAPAPKLGFTPKFKAANSPKSSTEQAEPVKSEEMPAPPPAHKLGFTPKFKTANMPKPATEPEKSADAEEPKDILSPENTEAKPAYKPRFNMKNIPKKKE